MNPKTVFVCCALISLLVAPTDAVAHAGSLCQTIDVEGQFNYYFRGTATEPPTATYLRCPMIRESTDVPEPEQLIVFVRDYHSSENISCGLDYTLPNGDTLYGQTVSTSGESTAGQSTTLYPPKPSEFSDANKLTSMGLWCYVPGSETGESDYSAILGFRFDEYDDTSEQDTNEYEEKLYPGSSCQVESDAPRNGPGAWNGNFYDIYTNAVKNESNQSVTVHCPIVRDYNYASTSGEGNPSIDLPILVFVQDLHSTANIQCREVSREPDGTSHASSWVETHPASQGHLTSVLALPASMSPGVDTSYSLECHIPPPDNGAISKVLGYMINE